ncbi:MAG: GntR family transcriptional regulator [Phycisphaerae bacterium]|nr:GntR family transcriptional regulator [Phycisphaerae bacterium]
MAENLKIKAYRFLRSSMIEGRWSHGEVYSTVKIAKNMGMSLAPVREAIVQLETEGLIEKVENRGVRLKRLNREELCDLFDVREAMETQAALLAVQRAGDEEVRRLREIFTNLRRAIHELHKQGLSRNVGSLSEQSHQHDIEFHLYLVSISRSKQILKIITDLHILNQVTRNRGLLPGVTYENYQANVLRFHYRIVRALERRDEQSAAEWTRRHIRHAREYHLALYDFTHQDTAWESAGAEVDWPGRVLARISELESNLTPHGGDSRESERN